MNHNQAILRQNNQGTKGRGGEYFSSQGRGFTPIGSWSLANTPS